MSTNKTVNYHLHSWVGTDPVKRTEFNENFEKIDTALTDLLGSIGQSNVNLLGLALEVETLKNATLTGVDANIFIESFLTISDITLSSGRFNATSKKIYI